jgi:hypothetical protein
MRFSVAAAAATCVLALVVVCALVVHIPRSSSDFESDIQSLLSVQQRGKPESSGLASVDSFTTLTSAASTCTSTLSGGDGFIQIGNWRFGRVDDNHFSFSSNNGRTSVILRSDGTVHGGDGHRTDWGLSHKPITWTYSASNPMALNSLPNVQFGSSWVQFGHNVRLGTPDNVHLSVAFRTPCCGQTGIHTAGSNSASPALQYRVCNLTSCFFSFTDIWRSDGTIHRGPRTCCGLGQLNTFERQLPSESVWFGEKFLQLGNFRIADIDGNHMSIADTATGKTAEIFRQDSTQHPGPRTDFNANSRARCPLRVYQLAATLAADFRDAPLPCGNNLLANEGLTNEQGTARLIMQGDGNLVLYNHNGKALWSSGTFGNVGDRLEVQTDGNLVVCVHLPSSNLSLFSHLKMLEQVPKHAC